jgi:hypothetical protein
MATRKVGLNMRAELYDDLAKLAEHYIQYVAPTQNTVRPEIMAHVRKSIEKNRKLLHLLAQ